MPEIDVDEWLAKNGGFYCPRLQIKMLPVRCEEVRSRSPNGQWGNRGSAQEFIKPQQCEGCDWESIQKENLIKKKPKSRKEKYGKQKDREMVVCPLCKRLMRPAGHKMCSKCYSMWYRSGKPKLKRWLYRQRKKIREQEKKCA